MSNETQLTALQQFASPIASRGTFIKASFGGFAGAGKTRTATEFIIGCYKKLKLTKPVMIIDNEKGARFLQPIFKSAGIETLVKETTTLADVLAAFKFLQDGEIDFLFIDSLSKVWYQYVRDYKAKQNNKAFMTLQDWGKILPSWQEQFSDKFVSVVGNVVFTGRGGYTYDMEENEETKKKEFTKSGVKMKVAGETPFETDLNIWMDQEQTLKDGNLEVWRTGQIMKDRSTLIDGKIFKNPTFKDFEPVIDFLLSIPVSEISGESDNHNLAPSEDQNWMQKKKDAIAEVEQVFNYMQLGSSKEDKGLKAAILKKTFGCLSIEHVLKLKASEIESSIPMLKSFAESFLKYIFECTEKQVKIDNEHISGLLSATAQELNYELK